MGVRVRACARVGERPRQCECLAARRRACACLGVRVSAWFELFSLDRCYALRQVCTIRKHTCLYCLNL